VHAIGSNIESNSIRSLSLIQAVEVKSGTAVAGSGSLPQCLCDKPTVFRPDAIRCF
jgi:hypothetical protein